MYTVLLLQLSPVQPHEQRQTYVLPVGKHVPPLRQDEVEQVSDNSAIQYTYTVPSFTDSEVRL